MKTLLLIPILFALSCSDEPAPETPATIQSQSQPPPPELDKKFTSILDEFEQKISNGFWTEFTSTTRRGGQGTTETTFDMNAYDAYMNKKGLTPIPNKSMGYTGKINNVDITISELTVSREHGGWQHQFTIVAKDSSEKGFFEKKREFTTFRE